MTGNCYCDTCGVPMKTSESICLSCGCGVPPFAIAASGNVDILGRLKPLAKYWPFAAGSAVLVLLAMLVSSSPRQFVTTNWPTGLLFASPLLAGLILTIIKSQMAESASTWIEQWIATQRETAAESPSFGQKWFMRPAYWMTEYATGFLNRVSDVHVRTGVKFTLYGYVVLLVVYLVIIVTMIVIGLLLFAAAVWFISSVMSESEGSQSRSDSAPYIGPRGTRLVKEGILFDTPTGTKINDDGQIVKEGTFFDTPTGMKIDDQGRLVKEGNFFDTPSGIRIKEDGQIVEEGEFFDTPSGTRIDSDGNVVTEGKWFDSKTGMKYKNTD